MAINLVVNSTSYPYPQTGDSNWGDNATAWATAVTNGMLQKAGGIFQLTADVDFGTAFGVKSLYFTSRSANAASTGQVRLANADSVSFRNAGNTGDLALTAGSSDAVLKYNSVDLVNLSTAQTLTNKTISGASNTLSSIAYASLVLSGSVVNADISASAAIAYSKLNLAGSVVNADISAAAAIAYSKLNLAGSVVNSDISAAAAIAWSKLATGTASQIVVTNVSGVLSTAASIGISQGGTGQTTQQAAINALTGTQAAGKYLRSDGTNSTLTAIQAADVPVLNQNTTGTASNVTGVIAIANGGTGQITKAAAFDALSPSTTKGDVTVFNGTTNTRLGAGSDGQVMVSDSTQALGVKWTSLQQGSKNYISYNNFENGSTTGWSLGTVGTLTNGLPTGTPTFGSGAAAALSISTVSTGQLAGSYSLSLASSAATTQGNMLATQAYNIDAQDQAKVLSFRFYYSATSGSANCNFSGTSSNSFAVAVYDVTNSAFIPVTGAFNLVQGSGVGIAQGTFQTNSNTASLRFIVYCANATSGAVTMLFDDFYVGPQSLAYGPAVTDWASYTPTLTGFGTTSSVSFQYRRNGDSLEVQGNFTFASATATQAQISLPSGLVIDNSKMSSAGVNLVGHLTSTGNSSTLWPDIVASGNNSWVGYSYRSSSVSGLAYRNGNDYSSSDTWSIFFRVPIVGWSSNTVMSADSDTRSVTFLAKKTATQSVTANTTNIAFTSLSKDSHAAWNGTDTYTVPVSGDYWVAYNAVDNGSTTNYGFIYLNGSSTGIFSSYGTSGGNFTGAALLAGIKAGDLITIRSAATTTLAATGSISIARVSGPATVAASESVNFRYSASSGQSLGASANTTLQFASKDYDTHNAFNGTTFTAPVSGKYEFSAVVGIGNTGFNAGTAIQLTASKNGSTHSYMDYFQTWSGQNYPYAKGTTSMQLNAGDTVTFVFYNNNSGALTSSTGANTWVTGKRVGN